MVANDAFGERRDEAFSGVGDPRLEIIGKLLTIMDWKPTIRLRASTSRGTPRLEAAIMTVSALLRRSRAVVISRAIVLADGTLWSCWSDACSARRRRVAHSLTTPRRPRKPFVFSRHQSSLALWQPDIHCPSRNGKRTVPDAENIGSLATDHLAHEFATVTGAAHDLLDGDAFGG
ncbi:hypothetical protein CK214_28305 [Mesorhizobium sp. WSM3882]|nr:hypothetical protein CK214_28305 [Mesorhizobium sp. WSM3882]